MESDLDENEPEQKAERIKIEEVIAATEKALAEKNREIESLKKKLEESSSGAGAVAMAAAALTEALDHDTAVLDERKRLKAMQDELQDKHRKAEVDISLERAKLARERAELEERMRTMEASMPKATSGPDAVDESGQTRSRTLDEPARIDRRGSRTRAKVVIQGTVGHRFYSLRWPWFASKARNLSAVTASSRRSPKRTW